ncbi:MAG: hypothetical protein EOP06_30685, partial [Proteobacteria bacterium]
MITQNKVYDVIIIGSGTAGLSARTVVSKETSNYLVIEGGPLGTMCARVGCMPSKVFIEAADMLHTSYKLPQVGYPALAVKTTDGKKVMQYVRAKRDHYVNHVIADMKAWRKTHLIQGFAKFISKDSVQVNDKVFRAKKFIIATGSKPSVPAEWRHVHGLMTTDQIFEMEKFPKSLIVIGCGPVGLEIGQCFARFGVDVTLVGQVRSIGGIQDLAMANQAKEIFETEMTVIDANVDAIDRVRGKYQVKIGRRTLKAAAVLVAIGRDSNLSSLDLSAAGADFEKDGQPVFDKSTLRIKGTSCYLA